MENLITKRSRQNATASKNVKSCFQVRCSNDVVLPCPADGAVAQWGTLSDVIWLTREIMHLWILLHR